MNSRSKDKVRSQMKSNDQSSTNIEELKRQILLKQALLDSSKNSRRKSTGALNTHSASST
jgi:hypothetical protein